MEPTSNVTDPHQRSALDGGGGGGGPPARYPAETDVSKILADVAFKTMLL